MNHFIVHYIAEINNHPTTGISGLKTKLHSSVRTLQKDLEAYYGTKYPTSKVKVLIVEERKITPLEFEQAYQQFSYKREIVMSN